MIGNDIVDIVATRTQSNWRRRGFLQKLFTQNEQNIIHSHHDPEVAVWVLWSMKEAAYKIYNRETGLRAFIPHLLRCNLNSNDLMGYVAVENKIYFTKTVVNNYIIDTVAVTKPQYLKNVVAVNIEKVYKDETGLPYVTLSNQVRVPVSVSNHASSFKAVFINILSLYS